MTDLAEAGVQDHVHGDDAPRETIQWGRLTPYLSLRFFQEDDVGDQWTSKSYRRAVELASLLPSVVGRYPPTPRSPRAGGAIADPPGISEIGATFFDLTSGSLESSFDLDPNADPDRISAELLKSQHIFIAGVWYQVSGLPPWLQREAGSGTTTITDVRHHLVLVAMLPPYIAVTSTHQPMQAMLAAFLEQGQVDSLQLSAPLAPVPDQVLETAFVNGEAYQLWLSGLHRSVVTRPDRKNLSGLDLRHALDPYAEQTYTYSAVISRLPGGEREAVASRSRRGERPPSVGFSRASRTVWMSKSPGIMEFAKCIAALRHLLQAADPRISKEDPAREKHRREARLGLNYLSRPIAATAISEAREPFEVHLDVGDPGAPGEGPENERSQDREEWQARGVLELAFDDPEMARSAAVKSVGTEDRRVIDDSLLPLKAYFDGELIARLWLRVFRVDDESLTVDIARMTPAGVHDTDSYERYERFARVTESSGPNAFTIRYQTGHVLEGNQLYKPEYQDVLFKSWTRVSLDHRTTGRTFDPTKEKPGNWSQGGWSTQRRGVQSGDSLFARVAHEPSSLLNIADGTEWYLLCHDQPNEVADFVYIEPAGRRITLIHVKGAHSRSTDRRVSIDAYQVVLAQAIKNLRHLDKDVLHHRLSVPAGGSRGSEDGPGVFQMSSRDPHAIARNTSGFVEALERLRAGLPVIHKKVVVFQPHIQSSYWQGVVSEFEQSVAPGDDDALRPALMLSSLLIDAEIACRKVGAEFEVWCDAS